MAEDLSGRKYNRWAIISLAERKGNRAYWNCICDCGKEKVVRGDQIKDGRSQSCGCLRAERSYRKHGKFKVSTRKWINVINLDVLVLCLLRLLVNGKHV